MSIKISSMLDAIADHLEKKGLTQEAYEIDKVANLIDRRATDNKKIPVYKVYDMFHNYPGDPLREHTAETRAIIEAGNKVICTDDEAIFQVLDKNDPKALIDLYYSGGKARLSDVLAQQPESRKYLDDIIPDVKNRVISNYRNLMDKMRELGLNPDDYLSKNPHRGNI